MSEQELILSAIYSDHMVLQRSVSNQLEGYDRPGQTISLSLNKVLVGATKADEQGKWGIELAAQEAGGPHQLEISGSSQLVIQDVYFGEVWLLGGQSNMELPIRRVRDQYLDELQSVDYPLIRQFRMATEPIFGETWDYYREGQWTQAIDGPIDDFSAIGYFFAQQLHQELGVPIGLIHTAVGGTPVEAWLPREALQLYPASMEELSLWEDPVKAERELARHTQQVETWHNTLQEHDLGLQQAWHAETRDLGQWQPIQLPNMFKNTPLDEFSGVVWLKRSIELSAEDLQSQTFRLRLGTLINADETFVNGKQIGETGYRYPPRKYELARSDLIIGRNDITVRLTIEANNGGFIPELPYQLELDSKVINLAGDWCYQIGCRMPDLKNDLYIYNKPNGLYNAVIAPLKQLNIAGLLFYQGESNVGKQTNYTELFCEMVERWRALLGKQFPVYYVQLANYLEPTSRVDDGAWADLREAQYQASQQLDNVALVPAIDLGEWNELHPTKKQEVAERLSQLALHQVYQLGPAYHNLEVAEVIAKDKQLVLNVKHLLGPLVISGSQETLFEVRNSHGEWLSITVTRFEDRIQLDTSAVSTVEAIRYAWRDNPTGLVIDQATGLPLLPFRLELEDVLED